jgi:hypothetical protein
MCVRGPDEVAAWSDDDVARRWWMLFPGRRDEGGPRVIAPIVQAIDQR